MQMNPKAMRILACGALLISLLSSFSVHSASSAEKAGPQTLVVGVLIAPPAAIKAADGRWEGFGIDLWRAIAQEIGASFEFREYPNLEQVIAALEKRQIDAIPFLAVREGFESSLDFGQSYLKTGLAIAVPAEGTQLVWSRVFGAIFSVDVLKAIGALIAMSLIAGIIVWWFERRQNSEMFDGGTISGIGHGAWWAVVTMATVGYGDKAPRTLGGRIVATIWMIFSIIFIASFTANITTSLTVNELKGKIRGFNDLRDARVGVIPRSEGFEYLTRNGIPIIPFQTMKEGLTAVASKKVDAFVLNEHLLRYQARNEFPGRVQVLPETFDEYFVSIALQQGSPLRKPVNKALLRIMDTRDWTELVNRYLK